MGLSLCLCMSESFLLCSTGDEENPASAGCREETERGDVTLMSDSITHTHA